MPVACYGWTTIPPSRCTRCRQAPQKKKRAERLATPTPDDNRVTHGCINVSPAFYEQIVQSTFEKGGVFYILPDKDSIAKTFPEFAQSRGDAKDEDEKGARRASK